MLFGSRCLRFGACDWPGPPRRATIFLVATRKMDKESPCRSAGSRRCLAHAPAGRVETRSGAQTSTRQFRRPRLCLTACAEGAAGSASPLPAGALPLSQAGIRARFVALAQAVQGLILAVLFQVAFGWRVIGRVSPLVGDLIFLMATRKMDKETPPPCSAGSRRCLAHPAGVETRLRASIDATIPAGRRLHSALKGEGCCSASPLPAACVAVVSGAIRARVAGVQGFDLAVRFSRCLRLAMIGRLARQASDFLVATKKVRPRNAPAAKRRLAPVSSLHPRPAESRRNSPLRAQTSTRPFHLAAGCTRRCRREGCCRLGFAIAGRVCDLLSRAAFRG